MDTDPPADSLAAAIGHGNEVAGMNNYGGNSEGYDLNEDGVEAAGQDTSLPNPKPKRIYNTFVFKKRDICLIRHKKGQQKQTTHDFSTIRGDIGIHNSNFHQISSALVGDHQLRDSHRSPPKVDVNREMRYFKMVMNHLQTSHECRGRRV